MLGRIDEAIVARAYDEINEFEAQQRDYGTLIVKLYFQVRPEVQDERRKARASAPWSAIGRKDEAASVVQAERLKRYRAALDTVVDRLATLETERRDRGRTP